MAYAVHACVLSLRAERSGVEKSGAHRLEYTPNRVKPLGFARGDKDSANGVGVK